MPRTATKNGGKPLSKREMDKEARRKAILAAAKKIFAAKGFHNTSVSDIVKEVGIAQGTFYLYFEDKKAIFSEIVDDLMNTLLKLFTVRDLAEFKNVSDVEKAIGRISGPLILFFQQNRDLGKIFLREAMGTGLGFEKKINEFYDRITEIGVRYITHFRKQGLIKGEFDPEIGMTFIIGGAQMIIYRWVIGGLKMAEADIVRGVADLCLHLFVK